MQRPRFVFRAALLCAMAIVGPASAVELGAAGGGFFPWDGDDGYSVHAQAGGRVAPHWRLLGEFEFRDHSAEIFGIDDVDTKTYGLRFITHYLFVPDGIVNPYVGGAVGLSVQDYDEDKVERRIAIEKGASDVDASPVAISIAVMAIVGVEIPLGDHVALFGEGRVGADVAFTRTQVDRSFGNDDDDIDVENLGGGGAVAGIRIRW